MRIVFVIRCNGFSGGYLSDRPIGVRDVLTIKISALFSMVELGESEEEGGLPLC